MHRNIVSLTKAMSLLVADTSALIRRILQAVQIRDIMYSPFSFRDQ